MTEREKQITAAVARAIAPLRKEIDGLRAGLQLRAQEAATIAKARRVRAEQAAAFTPLAARLDGIKAEIERRFPASIYRRGVTGPSILSH